MDYRDSGFDQFLKRKTSFAGVEPSEQTGDDTSHNIKQISGSSVTAGKSLATDGKFYIDWSKSVLIATDGARNRVEIGKIPGTESYGIRIYDNTGEVVFSSYGDNTDNILSDGSVTEDKIATNAVTTTKIANTAITTAKIGNAQVTNAKVDTLACSKLTTGTLAVAMNVGEGNVKIDGANKQIIINDGTNDRILIGYQSEGF